MLTNAVYLHFKRINLLSAEFLLFLLCFSIWMLGLSVERQKWPKYSQCGRWSTGDDILGVKFRVRARRTERRGRRWQIWSPQRLNSRKWIEFCDCRRKMASNFFLKHVLPEWTRRQTRRSNNSRDKSRARRRKVRKCTGFCIDDFDRKPSCATSFEWSCSNCWVRCVGWWQTE